MRLALLVPLAALALTGCDKAQAPTPSDAIEAGLPSEATAPANPMPTASPTLVPPVKVGGGEDECGAGKLGRWLNTLPTADAMTQIKQASGAQRIRTIKPGDAVTMDYSPTRLNVELGEDGRIKLFRCG